MWICFKCGQFYVDFDVLQGDSLSPSLLAHMFDKWIFCVKFSIINSELWYN